MITYAQGDTIRFFVRLPDEVSPETDFKVSVYHQAPDDGQTFVVKRSDMKPQGDGFTGVIPSSITKDAKAGSWYAEILLPLDEDDNKIGFNRCVQAFKMEVSVSKRLL